MNKESIRNETGAMITDDARTFCKWRINNE